MVTRVKVTTCQHPVKSSSFSLGTITSLEAKVPPQDVVQWNGSVYYSYGEYLVGPLVYKFPDAITELVPSENGVSGRLQLPRCIWYPAM